MINIVNTNEYSIQEQIRLIKKNYPLIGECIDDTRINDVLSVIKQAEKINKDFEGKVSGGRGDVYRKAQKSINARSIGINTLFQMLNQKNNEKFSVDHLILDVLGGDGLVSRAYSEIRNSEHMPTILTSDLSNIMVKGAIENGLPALRQPAQKLLLKNSCVDGLFLAYGTHHIPKNERLIACKEGHRVLKKGGRFLLHDFEEKGPVAQWFSEVVHPFSITGHDFAHFTQEEIIQYLTKSGFNNISIHQVYDPFILFGYTQQHAKERLAEYLLNMYGLEPLAQEKGSKTLENIYELACSIFRYDYKKMGLNKNFGSSEVKLKKYGDKWVVEMPRVAIVGTGEK